MHSIDHFEVLRVRKLQLLVQQRPFVNVSDHDCTNEEYHGGSQYFRRDLCSIYGFQVSDVSVEKCGKEHGCKNQVKAAHRATVIEYTVHAILDVDKVR